MQKTNPQPKQPKCGGVFQSLKRRFRHNKLGSLLVQDGILEEKQLKSILKTQKTSGIPLGQFLISRGIISRRALYLVLCEQHALRLAIGLFTVLVSLSCFGVSKARAGSIKDVPATMAGSLTPDYNRFGQIKTYPSIFQSDEQRSDNITPFYKWTGMFEKFEKDLQNRDNKERLDFFMTAVQKYRYDDLYAMAVNINHFVNGYTYYRDHEIWGRSDYWANPVEFLKKGGDCEDFAIAKYVALRVNGVPEDRLRMAIVHDNYKGMAHAVLIVYTNKGPIMLDNQKEDVIFAHNNKRYRPIFSINRNAWWLHKAPETTVVAALE